MLYLARAVISKDELMEEENVDLLESDCDRPLDSNPVESQARYDCLAGLAMRMRRCKVPTICSWSMVSLDTISIAPLYVIDCSEQLIIPSAIKPDTDSAQPSLRLRRAFTRHMVSQIFA